MKKKSIVPILLLLGALVSTSAFAQKRKPSVNKSDSQEKEVSTNNSSGSDLKEDKLDKNFSKLCEIENVKETPQCQIYFLNIKMSEMDKIITRMSEEIVVLQKMAPVPGPIGPRGIKGDKGERGLQGIKGDKGDTGETGLMGNSHLASAIQVNGQDIYITGYNLHIRSGSDYTYSAGPGFDGLGNLIIGYNNNDNFQESQSGTHNLVIGDNHEYTSHGGLVAGHNNLIAGIASSVPGGEENKALGDWSVAIGGRLNSASNNNSIVAGGEGNSANKYGSTIFGGSSNEIPANSNGDLATIIGGIFNLSQGVGAVTIGGIGNNSKGVVDMVAGGQDNTANGHYLIHDDGSIEASATAIFGGANNKTTSDSGNTLSVVVGGKSNTVKAASSVIIGGSLNKVNAAHFDSMILGGNNRSTTNFKAELK